MNLDSSSKFCLVLHFFRKLWAPLHTPIQPVFHVRGWAQAGDVCCIDEQKAHALPGPLLRLALVVLACLSIAGCSVRLLADYDEKTEEDINVLSEHVLAFYDGLLEKSVDKRTYADSATSYGEIETKIRVFYLRQQTRPLNSDSEDQAAKMLKFWEDVRFRHKTEFGQPGKQKYADVLVKTHRRSMERFFIAILHAEKARRFAAEDVGATQLKNQEQP